MLKYLQVTIDTEIFSYFLLHLKFYEYNFGLHLKNYSHQKI